MKPQVIKKENVMKFEKTFEFVDSMPTLFDGVEGGRIVYDKELFDALEGVEDMASSLDACLVKLHEFGKLEEAKVVDNRNFNSASMFYFVSSEGQVSSIRQSDVIETFDPEIQLIPKFLPFVNRDRSIRTDFALGIVKSCKQKVIEAGGHWNPYLPTFNNLLDFLVSKKSQEKEAEERPKKKFELKIEPDPSPNSLDSIIRNQVIGIVNEEVIPEIAKVVDLSPTCHEVVIAGKKAEFDGVVHEKFDHLMNLVANDIPAYLFGPAGSGKNVLCEQVAKALELDYYYMNSVTDEFKITGFIDANGIYHASEFYKAFTKGGVFFLDEIDASAPEVLVCLNMAIANRYFAFPCGSCEAHEDFRVVAAGNTMGTGRDGMYVGRLQLDAATLNRFSVIRVDYDRRIDKVCADGDEELVEFIVAYRSAISKCGVASVASYRNVSHIKVLSSFMELGDAISSALTKDMNRDDIEIVYNSDDISRLVDAGNKYAGALYEAKEF